MQPPLVEELQHFHRFLGDRLNNGHSALSPEEALDEWRRLHPVSEAGADDLAALQQALDDIARGDQGMPFDEFDREFRQRHSFPVNP